MDLNRIIKELNKGTKVEENLKAYGNALSRSYYFQSSYTLGMNLIENYDRLTSLEGYDAIVLRDMFEKVKAILNRIYIDKNTDSIEADRAAILEMRQRIVEKTDALGAYTYYLQIYEHILNREEFKFRRDAGEKDMEIFIAELMRFVTSDQNPAAVNEKMQTVMGELPVRLTLNKFKDMVTAASMCYVGVRSDLAEEYFENLAGCARKISLDALDQDYDELYEMCQKMAQLDLTALTSDECAEAMAVLEEAGRCIADVLMGYLYIIDIVNDLIIILFNQPYADVPSRDMKKAETVICEIIRSENKGTFMRPDEDIIALLTELTDRQAVYQGEHMMLEDALYGYLGKYAEEIGDDVLFEGLHISAQLFAGSPLGKLRTSRSYFSVDEAYMKDKVEEILKQFDAAFSGASRQVKRAVMALTFSVTPVVFNSLEDFRSYVISALLECGSNTEKQATMELIAGLMN